MGVRPNQDGKALNLQIGLVRPTSIPTSPSQLDGNFHGRSSTRIAKNAASRSKRARGGVAAHETAAPTTRRHAAARGSSSSARHAAAHSHHSSGLWRMHDGSPSGAMLSRHHQTGYGMSPIRRVAPPSAASSSSASRALAARACLSSTIIPFASTVYPSTCRRARSVAAGRPGRARNKLERHSAPSRATGAAGENDDDERRLRRRAATTRRRRAPRGLVCSSAAAETDALARATAPRLAPREVRWRHDGGGWAAVG